ncbi:MAG: hypothetical protein J5I93_22615 [Pirellulaceae bacterium]|nr:hypothetical protein [Pirellulaceae bacterium]
MSDSITRWYVALRGGDSLAAQKLWDAYFHELCRVAQRTLATRSRTAAFDDEDVVVDALGEFFTSVQRGNFAGIRDRGELWQLLVVITIRRAKKFARNERAQKRGGNRVVLQSEIEAGTDFQLDDLVGDHPARSFSEYMSLQCRLMIESLNDPVLEQIAVWKLAGHTNDEIASEQGCARITIQRKLRLIRELWCSELEATT